MIPKEGEYWVHASSSRVARIFDVQEIPGHESGGIVIMIIPHSSGKACYKDLNKFMSYFKKTSKPRSAD